MADLLKKMNRELGEPPSMERLPRDGAENVDRFIYRWRKKRIEAEEGIGGKFGKHSKWVRAQWFYGIMGGRGGVPSFLFGYFSPNSCCCCLCFPSHSHLIQLFALGGPWWMILPFQRCVWILSDIFSGSCSSALIFASSSTCLVSTIFFGIRWMLECCFQLNFKLFSNDSDQWSRRQNSKYFGASWVQRGWGETDEPHNNFTMTLLLEGRVMVSSMIVLKFVKACKLGWGLEERMNGQMDKN